VGRVFKNLGRGALLDDAAQVHDEHAIGEVPHDLEVVGDEQVGEAFLVLGPSEQAQDLASYGYVE
jgi:hypothetical protein